MSRSSSNGAKGAVFLAFLLLAASPAGAQTPNPPGGSSGGGGTGCTTAGSNGDVLTDNGAGGCNSDGSATLTAGALGLGSSGVVGSVTMGNATSGTVKLQTITGALGTVTASLPANTGTLSELNLAQSWSAVQTFGDGDFVLSGSSSGSSTIKAPATGGGTATLFGGSDTITGIAASQTLTNKIISGASNTISNIGNGSLTNSATTVNGQTCTLGSACTVTAAATGITIESTTIASGTVNGLLYDHAGVIGNLASGNSGVLVTSSGGVPSISTTLPSGLALGTPGSVTLTNATGLPIAGITGLGSGVGTWLATPSCANFFTAVTGETGSGACVGATSPTLVTPVLGVATGTSLALGGGSIGSDALEITGTSTFNGASNILAQLNVQNGTIGPSGGILIGADNAATTRTDATNKFGAIIGYPYTNAQNSIELLGYNSTTSANSVLLCGGNSALQACTDIKFYTAAATNTAGSSAINVLHLDNKQHVGTGGSAPAAGSCGTSPGTPAGNDNAFTIVAGATTGSCTVNFANSYSAAPICIAQDRSTVQALRYAISTSSITIIATSALGGDTLAVICQGN